MDFKYWLLCETSSGFELTIDPSITSYALSMRNGEENKETDPNKLKAFLKKALNKYFGGKLDIAAARYKFHLKGIRNSYETIFEFLVMPKGGSPEKSNPDDHMHDFNMKYKGGLTGYNTYKTPKDAVKEIPNNPNWAYRGMSWEEWQYIQRTGHIQSNGGYNFDNQKNLTFYGSADTAVHYGSSFAPMGYETSKKRPSVIIAIPKSKTLDHKKHPGIPESELAHAGPLDKKEIIKAWMLSPIRSKQGKLELVFTWIAEKDDNGYTGNFKLGKQKEGSRMSPSIQYAIRILKP